MPAPAGANRPSANTAQVIKKLNSGKTGTQRYQQEYGDALVCVRYRHDPNSGKRYTTVELVVDEREYIPNSHRIRIQDETQVGVHIGFLETEARSKAKEAGAKWDIRRKIWLMPYGTAKQLQLQDRVSWVGQ